MSEIDEQLATSIGGVHIELRFEDGMGPWRDRIALLVAGFPADEDHPLDVLLRSSALSRHEPSAPRRALLAEIQRRLRPALERRPQDPGLEGWCRHELASLAHYSRNTALMGQLEAACATPPERSIIYPIGGSWLIFDRASREGQVFVTFESAVNPSRVVIEACCLCGALMLPERSGLLVHATGLARCGRGSIFVGPSGAGKSTVAQLATDALVLSDDGVVVRRDSGTHRLHPSPLTQLGPRSAPGRDRYMAPPLEAIFFLYKDSQVHLEPVAPALATVELFSRNLHYLRFFPREVVERCLDLCSELCRSLPAFELHFRRDPSFLSCIDERLLERTA